MKQEAPLRISKDTSLILINLWIAVAVICGCSEGIGKLAGGAIGIVAATLNFFHLLRDSNKYPNLP